MTAITFNQIKAELAALRRRKPVEKPVGIRSPGRWIGAELQADGDIAYAIAQCDSPLAIREALRHRPAVDGHCCVRVVVTNLPDAAIAPDIFARLHRGRLFEIDRWSLVQQLFAADSIDPRLVQQEWLADAVVEWLGSRRLPAVKSGFLDADTLWREFLAATIGLVADVPDLAALFKWSLDGANVRRLRELPKQIRAGVEDWLRSRGGTAAEFVFAVADRTEQPDAVPLGLAVGVLVHDDVGSKADRAIGKLEGAWFAGRKVSAQDLRRAEGEAAAILRSHVADPLEQRRLTARAEELLATVDGTEFAHASPFLPVGYSQRLATFAAAARAFASDITAAPGTVEKAAACVRRHEQMHAQPADADRLEMAMRLVRWLHTERTSPTEPGSLTESARDYLKTGSFVDWARTTVGRVAASRELTDAIACIHEAATRVQERRSEAFAKLLAAATAGGALPDGVVPIERVLDDIVVPIARLAPVLLVVLDGMSAAVCRELVSSIVGIGNTWAEIAPDGSPLLPPALATIPSETQYSRASLLAGRLTADCRDEKAAFAAHEGLKSVSDSGGGPILYVKGDLGTTLPDVIRDEIASPARRVIAAVVNAVDDHLAKADQIAVPWSPETIKILDVLLHEGVCGNRVVVLTSDHGHVLERGSTARVSDGGERWRPCGGTLQPDEVVLRGRRVLAPDGEIVTSWSEAVRYIAPTKRGYHGGANPQEMIVPIAVLAPAGKLAMNGWQFVAESSPMWWYVDGATQPALRAAVVPVEPVQPPPGMLFDIHRDSLAASPAATATEDIAAGGDDPLPDWLAGVFASDVYATQKEIVGRAHPGDDAIGRVLTSLDSRGGKLTKAALARAISCPLFRIPGLLSNIQRVLNVDGYPVITVESESDTVAFDRQLLLVQLGITAGGEGRR